MILRRIDPALPHLRLIAADPAIEEHRDAIYVPFASYELDADGAYGLYAKDGARLSPYCRGAERAAVGGCAWMDPIEAEDAPDETYIYAGPLIQHYGHFLLATLSRLWPFASGGEWPRFLFHAHEDPAAMPGFAREMLAALGITPDRCVRFTRPTRLRHVIVPAPAFEEQHFAHDAFQRLCRAIGAEAQGPPGPPAYLSRSRLRFGVKNIANEEAVTDVLARQGVEILYPEEMPLQDQVALFGSPRVIMGLGGSSFHTAIFAQPTSRLVTVNVALMDNQVLIDRLNLNWALYLAPTVSVPPEARGEGILATYAFTDPEAVAMDLLRAAQGAG